MLCYCNTGRLFALWVCGLVKKLHQRRCRPPQTRCTCVCSSHLHSLIVEPHWICACDPQWGRSLHTSVITHKCPSDVCPSLSLPKSSLVGGWCLTAQASSSLHRGGRSSTPPNRRVEMMPKTSTLVPSVHNTFTQYSSEKRQTGLLLSRATLWVCRTSQRVTSCFLGNYEPSCLDMVLWPIPALCRSTISCLTYLKSSLVLAMVLHGQVSLSQVTG